MVEDQRGHLDLPERTARLWGAVAMLALGSGAACATIGLSWALSQLEHPAPNPSRRTEAPLGSCSPIGEPGPLIVGHFVTLSQNSFDFAWGLTSSRVTENV